MADAVGKVTRRVFFGRRDENRDKSDLIDAMIEFAMSTDKGPAHWMKLAQHHASGGAASEKKTAAAAKRKHEADRAKWLKTIKAGERIILPGAGAALVVSQPLSGSARIVFDHHGIIKQRTNNLDYAGKPATTGSKFEADFQKLEQAIKNGLDKIPQQ